MRITWVRARFFPPTQQPLRTVAFRTRLPRVCFAASGDSSPVSRSRKVLGWFGCEGGDGTLNWLLHKTAPPTLPGGLVTGHVGSTTTEGDVLSQ